MKFQTNYKVMIQTPALKKLSIQKQKKSKLVLDLSPEEEQDMVEWFESNPILYNRKLSSWKETVKKEKLWSDKSVEMGKTVDVIKIWYASLRCRYGKLKKKRGVLEIWN